MLILRNKNKESNTSSEIFFNKTNGDFLFEYKWWNDSIGTICLREFSLYTLRFRLKNYRKYCRFSVLHVMEKLRYSIVKLILSWTQVLHNMK